MDERLHVAIIMDGNGRWAQARGWPRLAGHERGARTLREVTEAAARTGVTDLTVYAFSSDNWKRPAEEVDGLMRLFAEYLQTETGRCVRDGIRLQVVGRRDRLEPHL
jgi:undecaprenyl diphosphate synthase